MGLALDHGPLYWPDYDGDGAVKEGAGVRRRTYDDRLQQGEPLAIAIDGTAIYWTGVRGQVMRGPE